MSSKFQDLLSHALYLLVKKRLSLAFILLTFTLLAAACGQAAVAPTVSLAVTANNAPMHIQDAWLYPPAIDNTAVYFTLINPGTAERECWQLSIRRTARNDDDQQHVGDAIVQRWR